MVSVHLTHGYINAPRILVLDAYFDPLTKITLLLLLTRITELLILNKNHYTTIDSFRLTAPFQLLAESIWCDG